MSYFKKFIIVILFLIIFLSCTEPVRSFSRIEFVIPEHIDIKAEDIKKALGEYNIDPAADIYFIIVLFSYTSGTETISFSGSGDMETMSGRGRLKGLVKVMNGKEIIRAEFVEGRGTSKEEMLSALVKEIKLKLFK